MKITAIKYLLLLFIPLCNWFKPKQIDTDITGVWHFRSNGEYMEIIMLPKKIHSIHAKSGNGLWVSKALFNYSLDDVLEGSLLDWQMKNDSLLISHGAEQINAFKIVSLNDHELHLALDMLELQLTRISDEDCMSEILKIETLRWDDSHFVNYLQGYRKRRHAIKGE